MEQESFPIFNFGDAIANLKVGHDIARNNLRLRLLDNTIFMVVKDDIICPWLPTHKDILATDWKVIKNGK